MRRPSFPVLLLALGLAVGVDGPMRTRSAAETPAPDGRARPFPTHWGPPPARETRDLRPLPGGYGRGSSTLARWIQEHLDADADAASGPRSPDGSGAVVVSGELRQWHEVTLTLDGPFARESDPAPNPFTDYRLTVTFTHESGDPEMTVPGYFAADGRAAETSADSGTAWRAHLAPAKAGRWDYRIRFVKGPDVAVREADGEPVRALDGRTGSIDVLPTDKQGADLRAHGLLEYVGAHHLRFRGSGRWFLKAGPDAPETLLACADFDGTEPGRPRGNRSGEAAAALPLKTWRPHLPDWRDGDPVWQGRRGRGLIGALNYLADSGCNTVSFLPYNAGGDGDNVWPFTARTNKLRYDCSKLDQWNIVFRHATRRGLHLHFKLQENEMDDERLGPERRPGRVPEALDGGRLGPERILYLRELIARFAHHPALNWNLGEENTQSAAEQRDMAAFLARTDPYGHPIVLHTFPEEQDRVYGALLGSQSALTGVSLQNAWDHVHQRTLQWVRASAAAGRPWVVANDEQGPASMGVPPDPGYAGGDGVARDGKGTYSLHDIRKFTLWGNLMAGGAGVEYYFGYQLPENDLACEDFRSRDRSWLHARMALDFFRAERIPFWRMANADGLVGNPDHDNSRYCLSDPGEIYLVYLPGGGSAELDLAGVAGWFHVRWFNPREGGELRLSDVGRVAGGARMSLGKPPSDPQEDWLVVVRRGDR